MLSCTLVRAKHFSQNFSLPPLKNPCVRPCLCKFVLLPCWANQRRYWWTWIVSKSLCQLAISDLFPRESKNNETEWKWQYCVWVWCLRSVVLSLSNHAEPYFLSWWSLTAQEVFFKIQNNKKWIKRSQCSRRGSHEAFGPL